MDAVFLGKLFAMLAVSLVGIACWASAGLLVHLAAGSALPSFTAPAVGWPLFAVLAVVYFSMGYLLLGSVFLAIGSLATTVREVQTLSMPVTMLQPLVFYFAADAMTRPGSVEEWVAIAGAVQLALYHAGAPRPIRPRYGRIWRRWAGRRCASHCSCAAGAAVFRKRVMKSGPAKLSKRGGWLARLKTSRG